MNYECHEEYIENVEDTNYINDLNGFKDVIVNVNWWKVWQYLLISTAVKNSAHADPVTQPHLNFLVYSS